jgi:hypothetical protein
MHTAGSVMEPRSYMVIKNVRLSNSTYICHRSIYSPKYRAHRFPESFHPFFNTLSLLDKLETTARFLELGFAGTLQFSRWAVSWFYNSFRFPEKTFISHLTYKLFVISSDPALCEFKLTFKPNSISDGNRKKGYVCKIALSYLYSFIQFTFLSIEIPVFKLFSLSTSYQILRTHQSRQEVIWAGRRI